MPATDSLIGQTIAHYRIVEKLGGGPDIPILKEAKAEYAKLQ